MQLKKNEIIALLLDFLRKWVIKTGLDGEKKIHVIINEAMKMQWVSCCRLLFSNYPDEVFNTQWELRAIKGLQNLR